MSPALISLFATLLGGLLTLTGIYLSNSSKRGDKRKQEGELLEQQLAASRYSVSALMDQLLVHDWQYYNLLILTASARSRMLQARKSRGDHPFSRPFSFARTGFMTDDELLRNEEAAKADLDSYEKKMEFWQGERRQTERELIQAVNSLHMYLTRAMQLFPNDIGVSVFSRSLTKRSIVYLPVPKFGEVDENSYRDWANLKLRDARERIEKEWTGPCNGIVNAVSTANRSGGLQPKPPTEPAASELRVLDFVRWLSDIWPRVLK